MTGDCVHIDKNERECSRCLTENNRILMMKEQYNTQVQDSNKFFEKMTQIPNKFDVIAEYLGRGLFKK